MRRRALLSVLPAVGGLVHAGCVDRVQSTVGLQPDVQELDPAEERPYHLEQKFDELGEEGAAWEDPVEVVAVGSGDDSHWVAVAAESVGPLETTVTLRPADGEPLYETTVDLSRDRYLGIKLQFRQEYAVAIESDRHEGTVDIPAELIDCNASTHAVLLTMDGSVESGGITTNKGCPPV